MGVNNLKVGTFQFFAKDEIMKTNGKVINESSISGGICADTFIF